MSGWVHGQVSVGVPQVAGRLRAIQQPQRPELEHHVHDALPRGAQVGAVCMRQMNHLLRVRVYVEVCGDARARARVCVCVCTCV